MYFKDKKIIVTGSTGYIGRNIVKAFVKEGAFVGCVCRDINKFNCFLGNLGDNVIPICADITNYEMLEKGISLFVNEFGLIDILINCAGGSARERETSFEKQNKEVFDEIVNVNLMGTMYASQLCIKNMQEGSIINISSYIGVMGQQYAAEYAAAKGGVISFTKSLAKEYAVRGIRVNCVSPGYVPRPEEISLYGEDACCGFSYLKGKINAQDVSNVVLFLASDQSKYIIGQNIIVDGGSSLSLRKIQERLETIKYRYTDIDSNKKYIIYATGNESQKYVDYLIRTGQYNSVIAFTDSDTRKWNKVYNGKKILPPMEIVHQNDDVDIVIAATCYDEIYRTLQLLGIDKSRIINYREQV